MTWEIVAAVAEMLAAIGVILSLIYLAIQVQSDTNATRANTTQLRAAAARDTFLTVASSESLAEIISKTVEPSGSTEYLMKEKGLAHTEAVRLNFFWMNIARATESNLRMPMSDLEREQTLNQAASLFGGPGAGWWQQVKALHSEDFVEIIDERIRQNAAT